LEVGDKRICGLGVEELVLGELKKYWAVQTVTLGGLQWPEIMRAAAMVHG